ncbi:hypothetical protein MIMGU_mgv1a018380mg, partial [Erythranthe guttata]
VMDAEITVVKFFTLKEHECFNRFVEDQKQCVCCWALVAAELVSYAIKTSDRRNKFMKDWNASAQELVDMYPKRYPSKTGRLHVEGCHVGHPRRALEYVKEHGITLKTVYPYVARRQLDKEPPLGIFSEEVVVPPTDGIWWHAVLIIGWGVDSLGRKFYQIKNAWGEGWGDHGYAKILCDIVYPLCYVEGDAFFMKPWYYSHLFFD